MIQRILSLALLLASTSAFQTSFPASLSRQLQTVSPVVRHVVLTDEETKSILTSAHDCVEGECSVDDVTDLVKVLKEQERVLQDRLDKVMNMIAELQHINERKERKTNEVRKFVQDMLRVFDTSQPLAFPTGFTGDIGDGPLTAYDALPPKKWKPSEVN